MAEPARVSPGGARAQERTLRAQGRRTLQRLLDAALVVFDKRGYHSARVDDICAEAHTSHGTFYLYFSSKDDLFRALLNDVSDAMVALASSLPPVTPDRAGHAALREWLAGFYDLYVHYHPVLRAWMEGDISSVDLEDLGAGTLGGFAKALAFRIEEADATPALDPLTVALAAVAMMERFSYFSVIDIVPIPRDQLLDTLTDILHVGVFGAGARVR